MRERSAIDLYLVLGHPVAHLRIPAVFAASLEAHGLPGTVAALDIAPDGLAAAVAGLRQIGNLRGFVVSRPHKEAIVTLLDGVAPEAEAARAVNIVRRGADGTLVGGQLDGQGFLAGMRGNGFDPAGKTLFIQGAGGAAASIGHALARAGAHRIVIANRTAERAARLAERLSQALPGPCRFETAGTMPADIDAAINATNLGTEDSDPLPFDPAALGEAVFVADLVNREAATALERAARARGLRFQPGRDAVAPQFALMHAFFAAG